MKHISPGRLVELDGLLQELRLLPALKEKNPGVFYRKSKAFLHFHEHESDLYADARLTGPDFDRFKCTTKTAQQSLLKKIKTALN